MTTKYLNLIAGGLFAFAAGLGSLALVGLSALPGVVSEQKIAAAYAQIIQGGGFGAFSAGVLGVFFKACAWDEERKIESKKVLIWLGYAFLGILLTVC